MWPYRYINMNMQEHNASVLAQQKLCYSLYIKYNRAICLLSQFTYSTTSSQWKSLSIYALVCFLYHNYCMSMTCEYQLLKHCTDVHAYNKVLLLALQHFTKVKRTGIQYNTNQKVYLYKSIATYVHNNPHNYIICIHLRFGYLLPQQPSRAYWNIIQKIVNSNCCIINTYLYMCVPDTKVCWFNMYIVVFHYSQNQVINNRVLSVI